MGNVRMFGAKQLFLDLKGTNGRSLGIGIIPGVVIAAGKKPKGGCHQKAVRTKYSFPNREHLLHVGKGFRPSTLFPKVKVVAEQLARLLKRTVVIIGWPQLDQTDLISASCS